MPNWCSAAVEISATEKEIKRLKKAIKDGNKDGAQKGLLNAMVPQPEFTDDQMWYSWNTANWGTKWDVSHINVVERDKTTIGLGFDTAWGPALQAFQTWAEEDPDTRTFTYKYFEPGMAFVGEATFTDGYYDEYHVDSSNDDAEYRRIAEEDWGEDFSWQDDEDDEENIDIDLNDGIDPEGEYEEQPELNQELQQALEELKRDFDALYATEEDPEYTYLKEDIDTLTRRVADYAARQEQNTFKGEDNE